MRVYFHTFGCKANQYDSERMRQEAEARGATVADSWASADVCVVNTCTVTNRADAEARRFVGRLARESPEAGIVVTGCSASLRPEIYRGLRGVRAVVPGQDPVAVADAFVASPPVQIELRTRLDRVDTEPVGAELLHRRAGQARGWLKVQDGCDRKCSFCATRLARGRSRSRDPEEIVAEARLLSRSHPELVITGIHIGHYGRDLEGGWTLARLVARLLDAVPGVRFRLGSVEATEVDDLMVDLLSSSGGWLAPHLHMPLQSGSDLVLRRMRRWHTADQYRERALEIVERVGPLGLGADVISGFPGEGREDHARTRTLLEELPFTYLHVFPFSPRAGTPAEELDGRVPQRTATERARELRALGLGKGEHYRAARVGGTGRVVLEGDGGTGLTGDYLRVSVPEPPPAGSGGVVDGTLGGDQEHLYIAWPPPTRPV